MNWIKQYKREKPNAIKKAAQNKYIQNRTRKGDWKEEQPNETFSQRSEEHKMIRTCRLSKENQEKQKGENTKVRWYTNKVKYFSF